LHLKIFALYDIRLCQKVTRKFDTKKVLANMLHTVNIHWLIICPKKSLLEEFVGITYYLIYFVAMKWIC